MRIDTGRPSKSGNRMMSPVSVWTAMRHSVGEPLTADSLNGSPRLAITSRTSRSTSVAFIAGGVSRELHLFAARAFRSLAFFKGDRLPFSHVVEAEFARRLVKE